MLSFARSVFMKDGKKIWSIERYLKDSSISWNAPFVMSAHMLVNKAFGIKNVVPNVSSAVFRNDGWLYLMRLLLSGKICPYVVIGYFIYGWFEEELSAILIKWPIIIEYMRIVLHWKFKIHWIIILKLFRVSCFVAQNYAVDLSIFWYC